MELPQAISSGKYECVVCRVLTVNLADLHRHQTYRHTAEELSLSSIVLRNTFLSRNETNFETNYLRTWLGNPQNLSHFYTCSSRLLNDGNNNFNHIVPLDYVMNRDNFCEEKTTFSKIKFSDADQKQKVEKLSKRRDCEVLDLSNISYRCLENSPVLDRKNLQDRAQDDSETKDTAIEENKQMVVESERTKRILVGPRKGKNNKGITSNLEVARDDRDEMDLESVKIDGDIEEKVVIEKKIPRKAAKNSKKRLKMMNVEDEEETLLNVENYDSESDEVSVDRKKVTKSQTSLLRDPKTLKNPVKMLEIALAREDHRVKIVGANEELNSLIPKTELTIPGDELSQGKIIENSENRVATLDIASNNEENREDIAGHMKIDDSRCAQEMLTKLQKSTKNKPNSSKPLSPVAKKPGNMLEISLDSKDHQEETTEENEEMNVLYPETEIILSVKRESAMKKKFYRPKTIESVNTAEMLNVPSDIEDRGEKIVGENGEIRFLIPGTEITIPARSSKSATKKKLFQTKTLRAPGKTVETLNLPSDDENNRQEFAQDIKIDDLAMNEVPAKCTRSKRNKPSTLNPTELDKKPAKTLEIVYNNEDHEEEMVESNDEIGLLSPEKIGKGLANPKSASKKRLCERRMIDTPTKDFETLESDNEDNQEGTAQDIEIHDLESKKMPMKHKKSTKTNVACRKPKKASKKPIKTRTIELYSENDMEEMPQENEKIEEPEIPDGVYVDLNSYQICANSQDDRRSVTSNIVAFQQAETFPVYPKNMDERTILVFDPVACQLIWSSLELKDDSTYDNAELKVDEVDDDDSQSEQELTIIEYDTTEIQDYDESEYALSYDTLPFRLDRENIPNEREDIANHRQDMPNNQKDEPNHQENMSNGQKDIPNDREDVANDQEEISTDREDILNYQGDMSDYQKDISTDREDMPNNPENTSIEPEYTPSDLKSTSIDQEYKTNVPETMSIEPQCTPNEPSASSPSETHKTTQKDEEDSRKMFFIPRPRRMRSTPNRYVSH